MAIIMFPIEVVGNVGRLLSLSVRLYANMFVGDILEAVFTGLDSDRSFRRYSWLCIFLFRLAGVHFHAAARDLYQHGGFGGALLMQMARHLAAAGMGRSGHAETSGLVRPPV